MNVLAFLLVTGCFSLQMIKGYDNLKIKLETLSDNSTLANAIHHLPQFSIENEALQNVNYRTSSNNKEDIVGLGLLGPLTPALRVVTRHFTKHLRTHNYLHNLHPNRLLLEPLPENFLQRNDNLVQHKRETNHNYIIPLSNQLDANLQSPVLQNKVINKPKYETSMPLKIFKISTLQPMIVNRLHEQNKLSASQPREVICNYHIPEETIYGFSRNFSGHMSAREHKSDSLQPRHFHHQDKVYELISKYFKKYNKNLLPNTNTIFSHDQTSQIYPSYFSNNNQNINNHQQETHQNNHYGFYGKNNHLNLPQLYKKQQASSVNGKHITINQNFQISQIDGSLNAVDQSQTSNNKHKLNVEQDDFNIQTQDNENFQNSQINGNYNGIDQSQMSHHQMNDLKQNEEKLFQTSNNNFQKLVIHGSSNSVSQSQQSNHRQPLALYHNNEVDLSQYQQNPNKDSLHFNDISNNNFQWSNTNGNNNGIIQGQFSNVNRKGDSIVRSPYIINFDEVKPQYILSRSKRRSIQSDLANKMDDKHNNQSKRQIKIWKLITDPNSQLDVSQTLNNVGNAARNAMNNKRNPGFHIKNAVGSAKNALISGFKIIPENLIIPSEYRIIGKSDEKIILAPPIMNKDHENDPNLQAINMNLLKNSVDYSNKIRNHQIPLHEKFNFSNDDKFDKNYAKLGFLVKNSVRSGKETLDHVGSAYSNAKKALAAIRFPSAPAMLARGMRIPEVRRVSENSKLGVPIEHVKSINNYQKDFTESSELMNLLDLLTDWKPRPFRSVCKRNTDEILSLPKQSPNKYMVETLSILKNANNVTETKSLNNFVLDVERQYKTKSSNVMKGRNLNSLINEQDSPQQIVDTQNTFDILKSLSNNNNDNEDTLASAGRSNFYDKKIKLANNDKKISQYFNFQILPVVKNTFTKSQSKRSCTEDLENSSSSTYDESKFNKKGRSSMIMGEKLITPFMGKLTVENNFGQLYFKDERK